MSYQTNDQQSPSIGTLLRDAGIISSQDLQHALEFKSQYAQVKLEEILVLQEKAKAQTINFFTNQWDGIKEEGRQFPIGHYLKQAYLLDNEQVEAILVEQKSKESQEVKFGSIALQKGWIKEDTINFFLSNLPIKIPQLISLNALEKYDQETLHLGHKYADSSLVLSRILGWTGGKSELTKTICRTFAYSDFNIPGGLEVRYVDKFIEENLIKNWQTIKEGTYLKTLRDNFVDNQRCNPILLLTEYRDILFSGSKEYQQTESQNELLILGLIVIEKNYLRITSLIYQQIFNQDWVATQLAKLSLGDKSNGTMAAQARFENTPTVPNLANQIIVSKSLPPLSLEQTREMNGDRYNPNQSVQEESNTSTNGRTKAIANENIVYDTNQKTALEPITKLGSIITLLGIILLIPLVMTINSYYSRLQEAPKNASESSTEGEKLRQVCSDMNLVDPSLSINLISQLERNKRELLQNFVNDLEVFPDTCETALNRLRILAAPQLGKEGRVIEAVRNLCKIPPDSESLTEAKIWLDHWNNSSQWGENTKSYLDLAAECPANDI